jgi:hypothetical protein
MNIYTRLNPNAVPFEDVILEKRETTFVIVKWNTEKLGDQPSEQELQELFNEFSLYYSEYAVNRRREYPPMADYIDGVVKGDQAQIQDYIDKCLAVKQKYPKP